MSKRHANEFLRTSSGRLAGNGMIHDRYDEESGYRPSPKDFDAKHSKEYVEEWERLQEEQPVITYKLSKEELEKYKEGEDD